MNIQPYRMLLGAALMLLAGAVGAQTADQPKASPENTGGDAIAKMAQSEAPAQSSGEHGTKMKTAKRAHHLAKRAGSEDKMASQGQDPYRQALRQCAEEKDSNQRDGCLDNAIEQFHRNS